MKQSLKLKEELEDYCEGSTYSERMWNNSSVEKLIKLAYIEGIQNGTGLSLMTIKSQLNKDLGFVFKDCTEKDLNKLLI